MSELSDDLLDYDYYDYVFGEDYGWVVDDGFGDGEDWIDGEDDSGRGIKYFSF